MERVNSSSLWPERTVRESPIEKRNKQGRNKKQKQNKEWIL
jgi:hypothetical protein